MTKDGRVQRTRDCVLTTTMGMGVEILQPEMSLQVQGLLMMTRLGDDQHLDMLARPSSIMACTIKARSGHTSHPCGSTNPQSTSAFIFCHSVNENKGMLQGEG